MGHYRDGDCYLYSEKLPFVLFRGITFPGALIFPNVLFIQQNIWFGVIGGAVVFALAFFGANVIVVVLGSIGVLSIYSLFF
ncbi:hypothetical protein J19TS1_09060 [Heyndrickxia oleronia]|nr:hypothetical protein J19TS1_09060 [Heyndrickxia oleronia]